MLACLLIGAGAQAASDRAATPQVAARLLAAVDQAQPGERILVGVEQRIIPHWHTYWSNPGDSGISTTVDWTLPAGAVVGDIQWPIPNRFQIGPVANFGYANEVILLTTITLPANARPGEVLKFGAKVDWLVCREECLPQQVELEIRIPVIDATHGPGRNAARLATAGLRLPQAAPWPVTLLRDGGGLTLRIAASELKDKAISDIEFFPSRWGPVQQSPLQSRHSEGDAVLLSLQAGDEPLAAEASLSGVLVVSERTEQGFVRRGYQINAAPDQGKTAFPALLLALAGGIILNLMPCVFPVLSIKALTVVQHAHGRRPQLWRQGLSYAVGILMSFALLALVLLLLKTGGARIGWGFQFQSPVFVLFMAYLMFGVGLSLSGVFAIGGGFAGIGSELAEKPGYAGSFFTGVLATVVATPCTAPFMGAAIGYAVGQPAPTLIAVFLSLGLGLALPFVAICFWPGLQRCLPRPGRWMERFKEVMAFPMYVATVWLVWVLARQGGATAVLIALGGLVALAFAAWLYATTRHAGSIVRPIADMAVCLLVVLVLLGGALGVEADVSPATPGIEGPVDSASPAGERWQPYSAKALRDLRLRDKPVFLNFTAAWCVSCLVNERVALSDGDVKAAFDRAGITYLKGDWTRRDGEITDKLAEFGRSGVPLYVFYPADGKAEPVVLPQLLTPEIVLQAINPKFERNINVSP